MSKLPFSTRIFVKTLAVIIVLVVVGWVIAKTAFDYGALQPQDWVGTVISTILLSYLIHLWLLPPEDLHPEEEPPEDHEDPD